MQVGDLVTNQHSNTKWRTGNIGMIVEVKRGRFSSQTKVAVVMLPTGERIEQITAKLKVVSCK